MKDFTLYAGEELHDLQIHDLYLIQNKSGYMFTSDSVLLANFVKFKKSDFAIELCAGSGVVSILASSKNKYKDLAALEIQESLASLAKRNFALNNIEKAGVICDSVQNSVELFGAEVADVVFCNPPYFKPDLLSSANTEKAIARQEICLSLPELVEASAKLLKFGGDFYMIYTSERLPEVMVELKRVNLEPKEIQMVQPKKNKESHVFLVRATKGGRPGVKMLPTLIMYDNENKETKELSKIYKRKKKR